MFDILLSFKIQKKIYWLKSYTSTIHQSLCLKSSGEAAGLKWSHSDGLGTPGLDGRSLLLACKMLAYVDPEFEFLRLSLRVSIPGVEQLLEQRYLCGGLQDSQP